MSMPSDMLACSWCGFSKRLDARPTLTIYVLGGGVELPADRCWGWCRDCNDACLVEYTPSREVLLKAMEREKKELAALTTVKRTFIQKVLFIHPQPNRHRVEYCEKEIRELELRTAWRETRVSPGKCLECGSENISYFNFQQVPEGEVSNTRHKCGGKFLRFPTQFRIIPGDGCRMIYLTPEGNKISDYWNKDYRKGITLTLDMLKNGH